MSIILTNFSDNLRPFINEMMDNKIQYAKKHGLDIFIKSSNFYLRPNFHKHLSILEALLAGYSQVCWMDMDCCFTNFNKTLFTLIPPNCDIAVVETEPTWWSSGMILVNNTYKTQALFRLIANIIPSYKLGLDNGRDEMAFNYVIKDLLPSLLIYPLSINEIGGWWEEVGWHPEHNLNHRFWLPGDFTIHLPGNKDLPWMHRRKVWLEKYSKMVLDNSEK